MENSSLDGFATLTVSIVVFVSAAVTRWRVAMMGPVHGLSWPEGMHWYLVLSAWSTYCGVRDLHNGFPLAALAFVLAAGLYFELFWIVRKSR